MGNWQDILTMPSLRLSFYALITVLLTGFLPGCGKPPGILLQPGVTQSLPRQDAPALYWIDKVGPVNNPFTRKTIQASVADAFELRGWAVDERAGSVAGGVEVVLDSKPYQVPYGLDRPDVAEARGNPAYRRSGFETSFPASALGKGQHLLSFRIVASERKSYYETPPLAVTVQ